jgi:hypothetical protein
LDKAALISVIDGRRGDVRGRRTPIVFITAFVNERIRAMGTNQRIGFARAARNVSEMMGRQVDDCRERKKESKGRDDEGPDGPQPRRY